MCNFGTLSVKKVESWLHLLVLVVDHLLQLFHFVLVQNVAGDREKYASMNGPEIIAEEDIRKRRRELFCLGPYTCGRLQAAVRLWRIAWIKTPTRPVAVENLPQAENSAWCEGQIPTP